ncbi:MAG TPA: SusD/RagB family nutrient-binding outer membrane lipoprotein [Chitinophagaceae bacterium]|nr:SusD/RagB family nutrient-binding outer membrane lipoprotein [Chitinophagaceae bacterium]
MKKINILLAAILIMASVNCKKSFSDLNQNNNKPTSVPPSLLFTGVLVDMHDEPGQSSEIFAQYYIYNYDYYGTNQYNFGSGSNYYGTLENVIKMENAALGTGSSAVNSYSALGKFFRAYLFTKMSLQMGDIPMSQALQGAGSFNPAYDAQKAVFKNALALLDIANTNIAGLIAKGANDLGGDIYYGNDIKKWQKAINTFKLRLLLHLSKKVTTDADLNIAQQFAAIYNDPTKYPVFAGTADDLQYAYITPTNYYPDNPANYGFNGGRKNMSLTHIGLLKQLQDPRLFVVAEPARYYVDNLGQKDTSFSSFYGADPGSDLGVMYADATAGKYSFLNRKHYYSTYTAEPAVQVGYIEMCFNIAEAANRGWITANAEDWYVKGIKASMAFYGIGTATATAVAAYFYRPGSTDVTNIQNYDVRSIPFNFNDYYAQPSVKYASAAATGLTQILQQKYLALFRQSGLETYYTYRRTGVPAFTTGSGTGNSGRIALRFKYAASEQSANTQNYTAALTSQFNGVDDINGTMWLLK